jgi:GMP synthase (glutamine-hydrolysing)
MARPPYLLLQSRDPGDPMRDHEVECFATSLGVPRGAVEVVDMLATTPSRATLRGARAALMGGSGDYSSLDPHPWISRMVGYVRDEVLEADVPTFASCFGLQVLTLALGGRMTRDPSNREVGTVTLRTTAAAAKDPLFSAMPATFHGQAGHTDRAVETPPGAVLLASSDRCVVNAFRVEGKPVWATQFHPELDPDAVAKRYMAYMEKYPPPDLPPGVPASEAPFLKRLQPSPHATRLLQRFAQWTRTRELVRGQVEVARLPGGRPPGSRAIPT